MRNPFHGVGTDVSKAATYGAEQQLFSDAVLERDDWTEVRASANDTTSGTNGSDELPRNGEGLSANHVHRRHGDAAATGTENSTLGNGSVTNGSDVQIKAAHVHADSSTHATISHAVHAPASLEMSASLSSANAALSAPSAAAAAPTTYPDDTNTGVTSGSKLQVYTGTYVVTEDNAVISNLEVHGDIVIDAKNVTMSNIKLVSNTPWHALRVMDDATGFTLKDSDIDGGGHTVNAIFGYGTFLRNNLHGVENGINVTGPALIQDNYIHDLSGGPDAHFDGIENNGAPDMQLIHNTIVNDNSQTSAVMLDNYFGGLSNITIDDNRLVGGGYTVYLDGRFGGGTVDDSSIRITNNQIGDGLWGNYSFYDDKPILSGNVGLGQTAGPGSGGGSEATVYVGTSGDDSLPSTTSVNTGSETYEGLDGNDFLKGGAGADTLYGGSGDDVVKGGSGDDDIEGQNGNDQLVGGPGADRFIFREDALATSGVDHINNLRSDDKLVFYSNSGETGTLNASEFRVGTAAVDANDHFIFDPTNHTLYYDSDGNGSAAQVEVVVLDHSHGMSASDILLM